jgi:Fe-S-cluster containining protein
MPDSCMRRGRCCTSFGVCVTPADIRRIALETGLEPISFIAAIPEPPDRERDEPSVIIDGKPSLLILKWSGHRRCIFYGHDGCAVYAHRPLLCRTYPFRSSCGSLKDVVSRACPAPWNPTDKSTYLHALKSYGKELLRYKRFAAVWNRHGGTLAEFLAECMKSAPGKTKKKKSIPA